MTKKRLILIFLILLLLVGLAAGFVILKDRHADKTARTRSSTQKIQTSTQKTPPDTIRLIATGDIIPHDAINQAALNADGNYDYYQFMQNMQPFFDKADVRFCNNAVPTAGSAFGIKGYPVFNSPFEVIRDMNKLGCNLVNTGTNHTNDKGQAAINAWLGEWDKQPHMLAVAGAARSAEEQNRIRYFEVKGLKFAFLSYTTYSNSPNPTPYSVDRFDQATAQRQLADARTKADIIIVSMRWGTEYSPNLNAEQLQDSQFLADNGADIVLGHGPHVLEPVKKLIGLSGHPVYVWYSLANFLNAQLETEALFNGIAVMDIDLASKTVKSISYMPTYMHYEWTAEEAARQDLLKRHDFKLYTLEEAVEPLSRSQLKTTIDIQRDRVKNVLNLYTPVKILHDTEY